MASQANKNISHNTINKISPKKDILQHCLSGSKFQSTTPSEPPYKVSPLKIGGDPALAGLPPLGYLRPMPLFLPGSAGATSNLQMAKANKVYPYAIKESRLFSIT